MSKFSNWINKAERAVSNVIPHQHSADRRAANQAVAEQISFYQQQKQELENEAARLKEESETEKKKIAEKQIRTMRRSYRAPGFMDEANTGLTDTLG